MFSRFFIQRPIFAMVISIVIVLGGGLTLLSLPIAQYPNIEPPTVTVEATYPGASAKVVAETVAAPIEQEVNGVEDMIYMSSTSANDGSYSLTVTFRTGTNLDMAAVLVQNRVAVALSRLPEEVKRLGVTTKKKATNFAMVINLISTDGRYDDVYLTNYAIINIRDELSRVPGAGEVQVLGAGDYSMRIWLNPEKLRARRITTSDVVKAISEQNVQVAAGIIGQPPAPKGQAFQLTVNVRGRLSDPAEFANIIIKSDDKGRMVRVKDVARVEMGAQTYSIKTHLNGKPTSLIMIYQLPGANLLDLSARCRQVMEHLSKRFPESVKYVITYDASDVIRASIKEIVITLFIAAVLVVFTVYIFLQDWRATLVPAVTIPVSLIGTFGIMAILGFSLNTLTLFGLVLAIGIVVDDAIVVVENTARNLDEKKLSAREAALLAMEEVASPVIATTLVLLAVFVPTAFMGGLTGVLYKQFALTIAAATVFSSINALTLSPALCALLLRPTPETRGWFFRGFNRFFDAMTAGYHRVVRLAVRRVFISGIVFLGIAAAAFYGMVTTPTGFVPDEDQGYLVVTVQLPDAASLERTMAVMKRVDKMITSIPGVARNVTIEGYSMLDGSAVSNMGSCVTVLEHWDKRQDPKKSLQAIMKAMARKFATVQEAVIFAFNPPALPGLGIAGGFEMQVQDRGGLGLSQLQQVVGEMVRDGNAQKGLAGVYTTFRANVPQLFVDVNREKVKSMGIPLSEVFNTLQAYLGSAYVNDFNKFGRTYQVNIQADARFRARVEDIKHLEIRGKDGRMLPLGTLLKVRDTLGPQLITRYNLYPSASLRGSAAPGYSSGQALQLMSDMADKKLPAAMGYEWTGISYQQIAAGSQAPFIFTIAVIFVFLVLAAQYESWKIPVPALLSVPMALFGAFAAILIRSMDNNVYTQIGLVLLIGLSAKSAILIVEFGKDLYEQGRTAEQAAVEAARLRFRPILMTAFSFILGVLPLLIATGAGAGSRRALGTAVFGGMLAATIMSVVLVPPLYAVFQRLGEGRKRKKAQKQAEQKQGQD